MRRFLLIVVVGALASCVAPASLFAQSAIAGVVKDATGAVLPGVTVEASKPRTHRENPSRPRPTKPASTASSIFGPAPTRSRSRSPDSRPYSATASCSKPTSLRRSTSR